MSGLNNEEIKRLDALFAELGKESGIAPSSVGADPFSDFSIPGAGAADDITMADEAFAEGDVTADISTEEDDKLSEVEAEIDEMLKELDSEVVDEATGDVSEPDYLDLGSSSAEEPAVEEPASSPIPESPDEEPVSPPFEERVEEFLQPEEAPQAETVEEPAVEEFVPTQVEEGVPAEAVPVDEGMEDFLQELEAAEITTPEESAATEEVPVGEDIDDFFSEAEALSESEAAPADAAAPDALDAEFEDAFAGLADEFEVPAEEAAAQESIEPMPGADEVFAAPDSLETTGDEAGFVTEEEMGEADLIPPELSDDDLLRIRNKIFTFPPSLQEVTRRCLVEETISVSAQHMLVRMLLADKSADEVRAFIEKESGVQIEEAPVEASVFAAAEGAPARRPSPILENMMPVLRIAGMLIGIVVLGIVLFLFVIKPQVEGKDFFKKGLVSLRAGNYYKAEDFFRRGTERLGKELDWYNKYGKAYLKKREYGKALKKFQAGLRLSPKDFDTLLNIADTYRLSDYFKKASDAYTRMLRDYPGNFVVLEKLGDLYLNLGDKKKEPRYYKQAQDFYARIISKKWINLNGQFKMLLTYVKQKRLPETREKYRQIKRINENAVNVPVMTEMAGFYQKRKLWRESRVILKKVIDKDSEYASAWFFMAKYYREHENYPKAEACATNAFGIDKRNSVYCNEIGEINMLFDKPQTTIAMTYFEKAARLNPSFYKPYVNLGDLYFERLSAGDRGDIKLEDNNFRNALENYEKAWAFLPNNYFNQKYLYNMGWLYYRKGSQNLEKAMQKWKLAYDKNPFHPVLSFAMGNGYLHMKQDNLAIAEYRKIIRYYEVIVKRIGQIIPYRARHRNVVRTLNWAYNNLGVAYELKHQRTKDKEWERLAILSFWKSREYAEKISKGTHYSKNNIGYVLRRDVKRGLSIAPEKHNLPRTLSYEKQ